MLLSFCLCTYLVISLLHLWNTSRPCRLISPHVSASGVFLSLRGRRSLWPKQKHENEVLSPVSVTPACYIWLLLHVCAGQAVDPCRIFAVQITACSLETCELTAVMQQQGTSQAAPGRWSLCRPNTYLYSFQTRFLSIQCCGFLWAGTPCLPVKTDEVRFAFKENALWSLQHHSHPVTNLVYNPSGAIIRHVTKSSLHVAQHSNGFLENLYDKLFSLQ